MSTKLVVPKERQLLLPGFKCTATGLVANKGLTEEQWEQAGHQLGHIEGRLSWYMGDWLAACKGEAWGYGDLADLCADMGWNYGTAMNCKSVCDAFEFSLRSEKLTFTHHKVAQGPNQQELLDWAEENNASVKELREEKRRRKREAEEAEIGKDGKYRVIYADPPWEYGDERGTVAAGGAVAQYPLMSIESLCKMDVQSIASKNAVLFMWVTVPLLDEAMEVIEAWGFEYKTHLVWDKQRPFYGNYSHVQHELLCICTRGSCTPAEGVELPKSVISVKKTKHSAKPHEFYELIETLYPRGKKIELFARNQRDGWDSWGNEA